MSYPINELYADRDKVITLKNVKGLEISDNKVKAAFVDLVEIKNCEKASTNEASKTINDMIIKDESEVDSKENLFCKRGLAIPCKTPINIEQINKINN